MRDLLNWVLFQLLIGNSDAHAKNVSFFVGPAGIDPAPAYDLVCLDMYGDAYDRDLSMAVGDTFDPDDIKPYQLAEMCAACGLPQRQTGRALAALCEKLLQVLDSLELAAELSEEENAFVVKLTSRIRENALRYLAFAHELPRVAL
jgi:serine/threonine-protein kinase HipA